MARSRLNEKRATRTTRQKQSAAAGSSTRKKYRDMIVTTLITLLITGLFGDFVIKRNIQSYNAEREAFEQAPESADQDFDEKRAFYSSRLKERRSASQQIIKYIKDNDIASFNAAYANYSRTVRAWNDDHAAMAEVILQTSQCESRFSEADAEDRAAAFAPIYDFHMGLAGHTPFFEAYPDRPALLHKDFMDEGRFCPTFFLTKNGRHSVHRQFRRIHRNIYNYLVNNHSECRLRHIQNLPAYYRSCANGNGTEAVQACTQRYDELVNSGAFCSNFEFDLEDYKVRDIEFNELDFYWGLGDGFFKTFRRDYVLRECQKSIGFWGRLFQWDCADAVAAYFRKDS